MNTLFERMMEEGVTVPLSNEYKRAWVNAFKRAMEANVLSPLNQLNTDQFNLYPNHVPWDISGFGSSMATVFTYYYSDNLARDGAIRVWLLLKEDEKGPFLDIKVHGKWSSFMLHRTQLILDPGKYASGMLHRVPYETEALANSEELSQRLTVIYDSMDEFIQENEELIAAKES